MVTFSGQPYFMERGLARQRRALDRSVKSEEEENFSFADLLNVKVFGRLPVCRSDADCLDVDLSKKEDSVKFTSKVDSILEKTSEDAESNLCLIRPEETALVKVPVQEGCRPPSSRKGHLKRGLIQFKNTRSPMFPTLTSKKQCKVRQLSLVFVFALLQIPRCMALPYLNETGQRLRAACLSDLKTLEECPHLDTFRDMELWKERNARCCAKFPGTDFHCQQRTSVEGYVLWMIAGCLKAVRVNGDQSVMMQEINGNLTLVLFTCTGRWNDVGRSSSYIREDDCTHTDRKIDCKAHKGWKKLCDGGRGADDKCICDPDSHEPVGFSEGRFVHPECLRGFGQNDLSCDCIMKHCPTGQTRNITVSVPPLSCDALSEGQLDYTCIPLVKGIQTSSQPSVRFPETVDNDGVTPPVKTNNSDGQRPNEKEEGANSTLLVPVIVIVTVLIAFAVGTSLLIRKKMSARREQTPSAAAEAGRSTAGLLDNEAPPLQDIPDPE